MLNNGMTTFGERDGIMRSECHGWSASPCFDLLHTVAGIYPLNPGFRTIAVKPNFGDLETMKVSFPHPDGMLSLDLNRQGEKVSGSIILRKIIVLRHSLWYGDFYDISLEKTLKNISTNKIKQYKGELNGG